MGSRREVAATILSCGWRGDVALIDYDHFVDRMALEQIQDFDSEFVFVRGDRIQCHLICEQPFADL